MEILFSVCPVFFVSLKLLQNEVNEKSKCIKRTPDLMFAPVSFIVFLTFKGYNIKCYCHNNNRPKIHQLVTEGNFSYNKSKFV